MKKILIGNTEVITTPHLTEKEMKDAWSCSRMFTKYGYFINNKPYNGDILKVLDANFHDDRDIVSLKERLFIKDKLLEIYNENYRYQTIQLQLV